MIYNDCFCFLDYKGGDYILGSIRVLLVEPNKEPCVIDVVHRLDELQRVIGGYVQMLPLSKDVVILCDEDGRLKQLPFNRTIRIKGFDIPIVGKFLVCAVNDTDFDSLSEEQIEEWRNHFTIS